MLCNLMGSMICLLKDTDFLTSTPRLKYTKGLWNGWPTSPRGSGAPLQTPGWLPSG